MNGYIETNQETYDVIKNKISNLNNNINFTSIIMLTYNQLEYTKLCIESIRKFTPKECYEIIIVDNASTDGTKEYLKQQDDLKIIFNEENKGFPKGCNQGIKISEGENILLLNNDTIVNPDWLYRLNSALYSNENIGAVGAISNSCSNGQQIPVRYENMNQMLNLANEIYYNNKGRYKYITRLVGFCYLIKKEVLNKIGLLDEIFTPGNYEDDDISLRIRQVGYELLLCEDTFIHHYGSASFNKDLNSFQSTLNINREKISLKWGFDVGSENILRYDLIECIKEEDLNKSINILQINCGLGATLFEIKNKYKNSNLYGLEKNENIFKAVNGIINMSLGTLSTIDNMYEENKFDYILVGDELQYTDNPWETTKILKKLLKLNGKIIATIRNANYISIINGLAKGQFNSLAPELVSPLGMKLFTIKEMESLWLNAALELESLIKEVGIISDEERNLISALLSVVGMSYAEQYHVFRYRIILKKSFE